MRFAGSALALAATAAALLASPSEAALGTNKNGQQQTKAKQQYKTEPCKFVDCPPLNPKLSVKHDVMVGQKGTATLSLTNKCDAENVVAQIVVPAGIKILSTSSKSGVQATVGALSATTGGNVVWKLPKQKSYKVRACPIESIGCGHWVGEARGSTESAAAPATEFEQRNTRIEPTPPPQPTPSRQLTVKYEVSNCADHHALWTGGAVLMNPITDMPSCPQPAGSITQLVTRRTKRGVDTTCAPTPAPTANADPHFDVVHQSK